jgi:TonB family protein
MKKIIFCLIAFVLTTKVFSQIQDTIPTIKSLELKALTLDTNKRSVESKSIDGEKIFTVVEKMPVFPGGEVGLLQFLQQNIKYPVTERDNGISGIVYASFVVDSSGKVRDARILRGKSKGLDDESLRVIGLMPYWKPGSQNGINVNVLYNLPISYKLDNSTYSSSRSDRRFQKADGFYNNGVKYLNEKNYVAAITEFTEAISLNKNFIDAYYNRGVAFLRSGQKEDACKDWEKCKKLGDKQVQDLIDKHCNKKEE